MKTAIKSFRMSQDVQDKLDADAKNANMTRTEYLNHLIVYAEKPISNHKRLLHICAALLILSNS